MWRPETSKDKKSILYVKKTLSNDDDKWNDIQESAAFTALPPDTALTQTNASRKNISRWDGWEDGNTIICNQHGPVEVEPLQCELTEKRARKVEPPASSVSIQDNQ